MIQRSHAKTSDAEPPDSTVQDVEVGAQVLAPSPGGAQGWTPVFLVQHEVKAELHNYLRLTLESGAQVCCTIYTYRSDVVGLV